MVFNYTRFIVISAITLNGLLPRLNLRHILFRLTMTGIRSMLKFFSEWYREYVSFSTLSTLNTIVLL